MKLSHYDFDLPDELIADRPCSPRQESKMLVCNNPYIDTSFSNFLDYVGVKDLVVINNTRVIPILLKGQSNGINFLITLHKNIGDTKWFAFAKSNFAGLKQKQGDGFQVALRRSRENAHKKMHSGHQPIGATQRKNKRIN